MIKKVNNKFSPTHKQGVSKQNDRSYRLEKSFKKKQKPTHKQQSTSPENGQLRSFRRSKQSSYQQAYSPNRFNKTQLYLGSGSKQISKVSLKDDFYRNKETITPSTKRKIVADLLLKQLSKQPYLIIEQLYQRNELFEDLLRQWQKQELYEQADKLIYRINKFYLNVIEKIIHTSFSTLENALEKCEKTITSLEKQNQELRMHKLVNQNSENIIYGLKKKLQQQQEKNKWASIFLSSFATLNFDAQAFLKQNFLLSAANQSQNEHSDYFESEGLARHTLLAKRNEASQLDKKISSQGDLQLYEQRSQNSIIIKQHSLR